MKKKCQPDVPMIQGMGTRRHGSEFITALSLRMESVDPRRLNCGPPRLNRIMANSIKKKKYPRSVPGQLLDDVSL